MIFQWSPQNLWQAATGAVSYEIITGDGDDVIAALFLEKNLQVESGDGDEVIAALYNPANLASVLGDGDDVIVILTTPKNLAAVLGDGDGVVDVDSDVVPNTGIYYSKNDVWNRVL